MDIFMHYGIASCVDALRDSGLEVTEENGHRVGIAMGAGIGGLEPANTRTTGSNDPDRF